MQADKDDMPEYLRSRKQDGPWRLAAITGIGTAIVFGGVSLFGKGFIDDANAIKDGRKPLDEIAIQRSPQPNHTQRAEVIRREANYQQQARRGDEDVIITNKKSTIQEEPKQQGKQTTFNDRNYRPNGAVNVVSFNTASATDEIEEMPARRQSEITVIGQQRDKGKEACWMHREGSVEKRECKAGVNLYLRNKGQ